VRQRMRATNVQPSTKRVDEARALVHMWERVESIARGHSDDAGSVEALQQLLGYDETRLAKAIEQQRKIEEMMATTAARFSAMAKEATT
jgi:hypothetical protein